MVKIAIWCRHEGDNIIGIGPQIPWHVSSDFKRFKRITKGKSLIVGEKTYESFPNRTLPNRKLYVLTLERNYQVSDTQNHFVVTSMEAADKIQEELYVCGGATVYKLFMEKGLVDIVVDSIYHGVVTSGLEGAKIDISPCVRVLEKHYDKITPNDELDNVSTAVWVKKGSQPDKTVLKHLIDSISYRER